MGCYFTYISVVHHHHTVCIGCQPAVMSDYDECLSEITAQIEEQAVKFGTVGRI